ncbi:MAG: 16S rRNA (cytidine(1402)-2'-O)-methyltransferase [Bacteroidota bacterium]
MAKLYLVPTPIGHLEDMTHRAVRMLKEADLILAEDTRQTGKLLRHYAITGPMQAHHQHNEHHTAPALAARIAAGSTIALVSDAGTPAISDPGFLLVRTCLEQGLEVECLPGPTAFVPALVQSGLPADRFVFEGFLPHKKGRQKRLQQLVGETRSMIFYASPHRLLKTLQQLGEALGEDRQASVSRELTKIHAETRNGTLRELHEHFSQTGVKGELVLVVAGQPKPSQSTDSNEDESDRIGA